MGELTKADIDALVEGETVATAFRDRVSETADGVALRWKNADDSWTEWTWRDYAERATRAAAGLRAQGVGAGDRVVIVMRNRPEFHVLDTAAVLLGATPISIYNSSSPEQVQYLTDHCEAKFGIVEDTGFLERFLKVREELPNLEGLAIVEDPDGLASDEVLPYASLLDHDPIDLDEAASIAKPDDLVTLIYTSGTTGPPKGVMISHYNVVWTARSVKTLLDLGVGRRMVSYLPMAHIAERLTTHYNHIYFGLEVTTCPDPGLVAAYTTTVRPEVFVGVPRVWEKVHAAVAGALAADPEKEKSFNEAVEAALPLRRKKTMEGSLSDDEQTTLDFLDEVAFNGVRQLIGMDQCEVAITSAAPISQELLEWFVAIGVPLTEIYGLSECTGPMTGEADRPIPGSVGRAIPGCEVALADDGEVICRGGNVFQGYLKEPEKTAETVDADGYFRIVDRKKELIITAGGKNISPANIEAALKTIPLVGQACAIGDQRKFMSALLVLDPDVAPAWAKRNGIEETNLGSLAQHPQVQEEIERGVGEVNQQFNNTEQIKKWTILGEEWPPDSDVLTPTAKLKRRGVHAKYADEIEAMYR